MLILIMNLQNLLKCLKIKNKKNFDLIILHKILIDKFNIAINKFFIIAILNKNKFNIQLDLPPSQ